MLFCATFHIITYLFVHLQHKKQKRIKQIKTELSMTKKWKSGILLAAFMLVVGSMTACQPKGEGQESKAGEGQESQATSATDSVSAHFDDGRVVCCIKAETPQKSLRLPVGEWLDEQLGGYYTGDMKDIQTLVDFYGKAWADTLHQEAQEVRKEAVLAYEAEMEKVYETDNIVTYRLQTYINLGGAHPSSSETGATFRKSDGKRLTWDIVRQDRDYLFMDVKKDILKQYFECSTDNELEKIISNIFEIPNPKTPPYFTAEGITLIYQQYEIAGYAAGLPSGIIPYKTLKPLMTEQAKQLLKP